MEHIKLYFRILHAKTQEFVGKGLTQRRKGHKGHGEEEREKDSDVRR